MRRLLVFLCCAALLVVSCDEAFDPHGEFVERPVMYCVMEVNGIFSLSQEAILSHTVPGKELLHPAGVGSQPFIRGAEVILTTTTADVELVETVERTNVGTPEQAVWVSYRASRVPVKPSQPTSITATLPDGRVLRASTVAPPYLYFELSYRYPHGFTTAINPLTRGLVWTFSWAAPEGLLHIPELTLLYSVLRADSSVAYRARQIPQRTVIVGGDENPVYPQPMFERSVGFEFAAIDSVFARLGREEGDYREIRIQSLRMSVLTYDAPLGRFFTSVHGALDPYSIRVDQTVYSNISGGIGVFGTYLVSSLDIDVDTEYAESFGYVKN